MANVSIPLFESLTYTGVTPPLASDEHKGTGYYGRQDGKHTVQYILTNNFIGEILIQGTLVTSPTETDWVTVTSASVTELVGLTDTFTRTFGGNFVWIRAVITTFDAGDINRVLYMHN